MSWTHEREKIAIIRRQNYSNQQSHLDTNDDITDSLCKKMSFTDLVWMTSSNSIRSDQK